MSRTSFSADYIIMGAGIVGLTIAQEISNKFPRRRIIILEKEPEIGMHSSGRNSGVLHSGIYYDPNSYKAEFSARGRIAWTEFCKKHKLPFRKIGKILLPVRPDDKAQLRILYGRSNQNGVKAAWINQKELRQMEPEANPEIGEALFVSVTSIANPKSILKKLEELLTKKRVKIHKGVRITAFQPAKKQIHSNDASYSYGLFINAAGLHADTVAHKFNAGLDYTLLPFKGIYWKLDPKSGIRINHLVYPVPDLRVPFLGVHSTTNTEGDIYLGPTAVPAFGRENYHGLLGIRPGQLMKIMGILSMQVLTGRDGFRRLAWQEGRRYFKPWFSEAARAIFPRLRAMDLLRCDKVGIRAQMYHKPSGRLANDFVIEQAESSIHVLNAISPAWTCSIPFAEMVVSRYAS